MSPGQSPPINRLVAALPDDERAGLYRYGTEMDLITGGVLLEAGDELERVYFPHAGLISLLVVMPDGAIAEAGFVGADGAVGTNHSGTPPTSFTRAVVAVGGKALSVPLNYFEQVLQRSGRLQHLIARSNNRIAERAQQLAACNLLHNMEARLCRWLLQVLENSGDSDIVITQESLAQMLGVHRTRLNEALKTLHQLRAVTPTQRGALKIIDANLIAERVCDCYVALHDTAPFDPSRFE